MDPQGRRGDLLSKYVPGFSGHCRWPCLEEFYVEGISLPLGNGFAVLDCLNEKAQDVGREGEMSREIIIGRKENNGVVHLKKGNPKPRSQFPSNSN